MSYKPRSLFRLIEDKNQTLFLPHIQRPFVWTEEQMQRLFDSLMRNYPIQTLLFWRTTAEIKARKFMDSVEWDAELHELYDKVKSSAGIEKVFVLDGQQRLQTLFALFAGAVKSSDGKTDNEAFFDVISGEKPTDDGLLFPLVFTTKKPADHFYRLRDLRERHGQKNAEEIADELNDVLDGKLAETADERKNRQRRVRRNIAQVRALLTEERFFWVEELDGVANEYPYQRIVDIFVRVNSGGTKLDAGDLMFAAMKGDLADIEEHVERMVDMLNGGRLCFDKSFVLKCLVVAHGQGAELGPELFTSPTGAALLKTLDTNWPQAENTFKQLRDFIENDLKVYSDKVVRSYSSFVPLFDYLYHNPKPDEKNRLLMGGYYYKSQLFNWYRAQTDRLIDVMHGLVGKALPGGFPLADVKSYFEKSRGASVELKKSDLLDIRLRFIFLNILYVQKFGTSPFNVLFKANEPQIDHIYPQSSLRSKLGLATPDINHLGNYRYIGASENLRKRAELPADYFARLKKGGVNIENHLLLADKAADPAKLTMDAAVYRDFRDKRLDAVFEITRKVVNPEVP